MLRVIIIIYFLIRMVLPQEFCFCNWVTGLSHWEDKSWESKTQLDLSSIESCQWRCRYTLVIKQPVSNHRGVQYLCLKLQFHRHTHVNGFNYHNIIPPVFFDHGLRE